MKRIETEIWEKTSEDPRMVRYVGQRTAQEVFAELKHRLESTGYLPDEYFRATRSHTNTIPQKQTRGRLDHVVLKMGGFQ